MLSIRRLPAWLAEPQPDHVRSRGLFLRGLAAVFAVAFLSVGIQARGLFGAEGILPVADLLAAARAQLGNEAPWRLPTLFWLWDSDAALVAVSGLGCVLSGLLFVGVAPRLVIAVLWLLYLSLASAGQLFLSFQWDVLLLESAALAILVAPPGWRPGRAEARPPTRGSLLLLRWLLFRVMFLSGAVKLLSGDAAWRDLSALSYHYWTQPLPSPLSPFAHALPDIAHRLSGAATFVLEGLLPFAVFGPRQARLVAAIAFVAFQIAINLTGNYGFFGLLSCVLCVPLIDDRAWESLARWLPGRIGRRSPPVSLVRAPQPPRASGTVTPSAAGLAAVCLAVLLLTGIAGLRRLAPELAVPGPIVALQRAVAPLRSFNAYGLFAVMTRDRLEITVEGSRDGVEWVPYDFRFKPDRLEDPPPFVPLHMPRLDWQMWFASLRGCQRGTWVLALQRRLLEGSKPVLGLFASDPFAGEPPRYLRTRIARYEFADRAERARGLWWRRDDPRDFCPPVMLEEGRLVRADFATRP